MRFNYRCTERITINDMMGSVARPRRGGPALRAVPQGLPHHRGRLCGRLLQDRPRRGDARRAIPLHPVLGRHDRQKLHPWPGFLASVCQLRPESRGIVRIKSADPAQAPAIQPRYMTAPPDRDVHGGGHAAPAPRHGPARDHALHRRGAGAGPERAERRRPARIRAPERHDDLPSDLDLPHGLRRDRRGGRAAARARLRRPARRRRARSCRRSSPATPMRPA